MTANANPRIKEEALAKLERIQRSPHYRSFFSEAAIDAFAKVEGSVFAGKAGSRTPDADIPR